MAKPARIHLALDASEVDEALLWVYGGRGAEEAGQGVDRDVADGCVDLAALGQKEASLLYGELPTHDFLGFLRHLTEKARWEPGPAPCFADIGCGAGRLLVSAAMAGFARCVGVEIVPSLCAEARAAADTLQATAGGAASGGAAGAAPPPLAARAAAAAVEIAEGSFAAELGWTRADVAFVHALAFDGALRARLVAAAAAMRPGAILCSTAKLPAAGPAWEAAAEPYCDLPALHPDFWEHETVYAYRRLGR